MDFECLVLLCPSLSFQDQFMPIYNWPWFYWLSKPEYREKYAKPEDIGAAPEEKSSDEEPSEDEYDSEDEEMAGPSDP